MEILALQLAWWVSGKKSLKIQIFDSSFIADCGQDHPMRLSSLRKVRDKDGVQVGGQRVTRSKTGEKQFPQRPKEEEILIRKNSTWLNALEDRDLMGCRVC